LISRVFLMRKLISKHLCRLKPFLPSEEVRLNLGHLCGTCRLGSDRATSVLDPNNKVWDTDNLYVVDASFFPTSAGRGQSRADYSGECTSGW
jgi:choline dehydrogenase-like flavoprotein